jgi:hypothetical protein
MSMKPLEQKASMAKVQWQLAADATVSLNASASGAQTGQVTKRFARTDDTTAQGLPSEYYAHDWLSQECHINSQLKITGFVDFVYR